MSWSRVAVLNRGDAAMRFIRTARELARGDGPRLEVVAVFTDPDRDAPFVRLADDAVALGPAMRRRADGSSVSAYCDRALVVERLLAAGCDAVWPGWGFASEDPEMVDALHAAGLVFIGPPADAMRLLGDKARAKQLAQDCGVPLAPWARLDLDDDTTWLPAAGSVGYPVMVKAANGGGGRGIRKVEEPGALVAAVHAVVAEATAAFGPGEVLVERCVDDARHVEVQFLVNADGVATTFGVRDCSLQRRHQKVIEETPSPVLTPVEEARLTAATTRLAEAAGYRGVGTAEYLFTPSDRSASFCEVNARLQVEHTVTEMVWGIDLVRAQIDVALGRGPEISPGPRGWAVEARLAAEDPERGFAPAPGRVLVHRPPAGPNVRVDAGIRAGTTVPPEFDSMIAKVLAWGPTRERALSTLARAVGEYEVLIEDGSTNRGALVDLLSRPEVRDAACSTTWLESVDDLGADGRRSGSFVALAVTAITLAGIDRDERVRSYFAGAGTGVPVPDDHAGTPVELELSLRGVVHRVAVASRGDERWSVCSLRTGEQVDVVVEPLDATAVVVTVAGRSSRVLVHRGRGAVVVDVEGTVHRVAESAVGVVAAPGPALVVSLAVDVGDEIESGQRLGTLESMKTESPILAERSGVVDRVLVRPGDHVAAGQPLLSLRDGAGVAEVSTHTQDWSWPTAEAADASARPPLLDVVDSVVHGREVTAAELDLVHDVLERPDPSGGTDELDVALRQRLRAFVDIEALFERNLLLLDDHSGAVSAESAFHELCGRLGQRSADHDGAPLPVDPRPELEPLLAEALGRSTGEWSDTPALRRALWRLASTRSRLAERERLMTAVVRRLASHAAHDRGLAGASGVDHDELRDLLGRLEQVATGSMGTLAGIAALVRAELDAATDTVAAVAATTVDPWELRPLARYASSEAVTFEVLDAAASPAGRVAVVVVQSCEEPSDVRSVLAVELLDVPRSLADATEAHLDAAEQLFGAGVAMLRRHRERSAPTADRDAWWAAVHMVLSGTSGGDAATLMGLSRRFEPGTRGLALSDFTVALLPDGDPCGPGTVEFSLRRRGHARLEVDVVEGVAPARTRTALDRRALTAKRLGVVDPWELIGLLEGRVSPDELPHPSLAKGQFVEHDLAPTDGDLDRLVPVDRPPAAHTCSVIVGVVANPLPDTTSWMERVWIAGDPLRSMGSLGEPECRRVIAAIDLAEERGLPVEWISLSSGARIAWDSGTENLDWTAAVLRRIVEFTGAGGEIDVVVAGVNVGAQSYWNAEATMLMHTRGVLIMTPASSMVLTGRRALELSGSVGALDEIGIGGHDRIMGPNGQAQYRAPDLAGAMAILMDHHSLSHGAGIRLRTSDPVDRDVRADAYDGVEDFATVGEIFDESANPGRKRPFSVRAVMDAVVDRDAPRLERWRAMEDADGAVVWETRLGGRAATVIGIESRGRPRGGSAPVDGPAEWAGGTLYPAASKKVARALRAASGTRPVVVLANLSGFDGSPESLRRLQLEYGAEIARAVVDFEGRIVFVVIGRYHGGAYVVFSKRLNDGLVALAVEGSYASVIGGAPAAAVVLTRDVRARVAADPAVVAAGEQLEAAVGPDERMRRLEALDAARAVAQATARAEVAAEFDAVHTVERAVQVGSLDAVIPAAGLRPEIIGALTPDD